MPQNQPNNPLHGVTLQTMLEQLIERRGFEYLGARVDIRCFTHEPSLASSLKFLRRTEWARAAVERLYLAELREIERKRERNRKRAEQRAFSAGQGDSAATTPSPATEKERDQPDDPDPASG